MTKRKMYHEHYYTEKPTSKLKSFKIHLSIFNRNYTFETATGVFSYKKVDKGTLILLNSINLPEKNITNIFDLGCGYGVIGIVVADLLPHSHVIMVDINNRATKLSKRNITLNNIKNAEVKTGHLFEPVINLKFDAIIMNPPIAHGKILLHEAFWESFNHLNENGSLQLVIKTKYGAKSAFNKLQETFGRDNTKLLNIESGYRVFYARKI